MNFIVQTVIFALYMIKTYFFYKLVGSFATVRKTILFRVCAPISLLFIVNVVIFNQDFINISYTLIGFILIMLVFYEGNPIRRISCVFVLYPIIVSVNFIEYSVIRNSHLENHYYGAFSLQDVIDCLIVTVFWYLLYYFFSVKIKQACSYLTVQLWILLDIICLTPMIATFVTILYTDADHINQIVILILASIVTNLGIIYLIVQLAANVRIGLENKNLKLEQQYYHELEKNQTEIRKIRHDMNHHLSTIGTYLTSNDMESATKYFHELKDLVTGTNRIFSKNGLINAVINAKYNQAQREGIDCFVNIDIDQPVNIDDLDLCSLFSNTMDNAIEALMEINDLDLRKMEVRARISKGFFSYEVTNPYRNIIKEKSGVFLTTKENSKEHGYGLCNVSSIVDKYEGTMNIEYAGDIFRVLIIIPVRS